MIDLSIDDDDDDDEGGYDKMKIDRLRYDGCLIVKQVVAALDRSCPSMHPSSSSSSSSSTSSSEELSFASLLRKSLTNLLLTEVDCIKKFQRQSYPYIIKVTTSTSSSPEMILTTHCTVADGPENRPRDANFLAAAVH